MSGVFGGGDVDIPEQYSAYKNGDYMRWEAEAARRREIDFARARGDYQGPAEGYAPINGTPVNDHQADYSGGLKGVIDKLTDGSLSGRNEGIMSDAAFAALANKIKQDPGAATELAEYNRQSKIGVGKIGIDKAFTKFDQPYYDQYKTTYQDYYRPEVDRQYADANSKLIASLAGRGLGASSVAAGKQADLARDAANVRTDIANQANDAAGKLRGQVENAKSNMNALNQQSADPSAVNARAAGEATALVAPPTYSPLGQVFTAALAPLASYSAARAAAPVTQYKSPFASGAGSSRIVR